ncbi:MAG: GIY-YIG nuclease family protein [Candidatus Pacebacteria bacterium]|nr:GIY-YIG nuclease family protein [Candidatus Paceibacterota bacterium]
MTLEKFKKIKLPDKPGVYFFYQGKEIIYVGKATSLKDRVKSYFGKDLIETRGPLLVDMVFCTDKIKWQETDSVLEALILEASLIKKYQPKYNTKEKSDKSFNYVVITKPARTTVQSGGEQLPKVVIVRGKDLRQEEKNSSSAFGPFPNSTQLREAMRIVRKIFPFLDDKSKNYAEFYRQINLVPDLGDRKMYLQNIRNIKLFFNGKKKNIFQNLKKEMKQYAKAREFEKAGEIKRQMFALQHINDVALLKLEPIAYSLEPGFRIEAYDIAHMSGKNMVGVMTVLENNVAVKSEYKKFKIRTQADANDTGALLEVLERRLAHPEWTYPKLIVIDGGVAQLNTATKVLKNMGVEIPLVSVVKDDRHRAKGILGNKKYATSHESAILLANNEAHRFAIAYHKNMRNKNFLK